MSHKKRCSVHYLQQFTDIWHIVKNLLCKLEKCDLDVSLNSSTSLDDFLDTLVKKYESNYNIVQAICEKYKADLKCFKYYPDGSLNFHFFNLQLLMTPKRFTERIKEMTFEEGDIIDLEASLGRGYYYIGKLSVVKTGGTDGLILPFDAMNIVAKHGTGYFLYSACNMVDIPDDVEVVSSSSSSYSSKTKIKRLLVLNWYKPDIVTIGKICLKFATLQTITI